MKYNQTILHLELNHFYLQVTDYDEIDEPRLRGLMGHLVRKARKEIPEEWDVKERIHHLLQLFYGDWAFHCDPETYFYARNLYLPYILEEREGMPVSLGALVLYLANRLKLPIYPVNFPTQLILRAEVDGEVAFIDPWNGQYISREELQKLYEGAFGFGAEIQPEDLAIANEQLLVSRFQQVVKNALIREEQNELAFKYIDGLLWKKDPYDFRDRGLVLAQMGAYSAAIADLEYFVEKCPQDPTAALLKTQLQELRGESLKELHAIH